MQKNREKARLKFIYENAENVALFFARIRRETDLYHRRSCYSFALTSKLATVHTLACQIWDSTPFCLFNQCETNRMVYAKKVRVLSLHLFFSDFDP